MDNSYQLVGDSAAMAELMQFITKAGPTDSTVLIEGETGTGKELVAQALHQNSHRSGRPFVPINCAALPEHLIESELFGHERGAFTGAITSKKGEFEIADAGTIFLDEVGELTLSQQAKLLRVLQEREIKRIGGTRRIPVNVRIIAATNRDLTGSGFRQDLYYRLNVLSVRTPALRDRPGDIPILARHFLERSRQKTARAVSGISPEAESTLVGYHWPGNVRELR
jgi:transcriptional regulator with GAF, ATPase, and Fis domain